MHGSIEQLEGDYSFGFPYDKLSDIVANKEKAIEKIKEYLENIGMWDIKIWDGTIFIEQKKNCITVTGVLKQELLQKY